MRLSEEFVNATTWEKLKIIAEKDKVYSEAANSIYEQNSDETVRMMCEARREAIFHEQYVQKKMDNLEKQLSQKDEQLNHQSILIEQLQSELKKYKNN